MFFPVSSRFTEKVARHCVAEVALALKYLHEHGVVHRCVWTYTLVMVCVGTGYGVT